MKLVEVLARLDGVKQAKGGFVAKCPAHQDKTPSLFISEYEGKILLCCYTGCSFADVVHSMGLRVRDMFTHEDGSPPVHWDGVYGSILDLDKALLLELLVAEMSITARLDQFDRKFRVLNPEKVMQGTLMERLSWSDREALAYKRIKSLLEIRNERL